MVRAFVLTVGIALICALQFVPRVGIGDARALVMWTGGPDSPCFVASFSNYPAVCSRQMAYEACMQHNNYYKTHGSPNALGCVVTATVSGGAKGSYGSRLSSTNRVDYFNWGVSCPADKVWDDLSKTCFDSAACRAKPSEPIGTLNVSLVGLTMCRASCNYAAQGGKETSIVTGDGSTLNAYVGGEFVPSGSPCGAGDATAPPITDPPQKQVCVGVPGQTMCKRSDGKLCVSASTGKQICWASGEVGEKADGPLLQVRNAGSLPVTPATPPPQGDTFTQQGAPRTATETVSGAQPVTTTVTNYTTSTGVNALPGSSSSSGEPADGSTQGPTQTGDSDAERNSLLGSIKDKLSSIYDGLTGDGQDHSGDGATPGDTQVWGDDEVIDGSQLDASGWLGGAGSCPALWDPGGEGLAGAFAISTPQQWCDFIGWLRAILIATATIAGIIILAKGGKG